MNRVHTWLSRIEAAPGLNEKKEILQQCVLSGDGDIVTAYLSLVLDPRVTFGVSSKSLPSLEYGDRDLRAVDVFALAISLATRELSGNAARTAVASLLSGVKPDHSLWVLHLLNKDLNVGLLTTSVNSVVSNLIYTVPLMLAKPEADLDHLKFPAIASLKKNGVRVVIMAGENGLQIITRGGHPLEGYAVPSRMIQDWDPAPFADYVLDGEAMVSTGWLQDTMTVLRRLDTSEGDLDMTFHPFDCIPVEEWGKSGTRPYRKRLMDLAQISKYLGLTPVSGKLVYSLSEVTEEFKRVKALGEEGLVCKPLDGPYEPKRSFWWIKVKGFDPVDGQIIRVLEGKAGKKYDNNLGSIELQDESGCVYRAAFSGDDQVRKDLWEQREQLIGRWAHFKVLAKTRSGSGQNAVFLGLRDEK